MCNVGVSDPPPKPYRGRHDYDDEFESEEAEEEEEEQDGWRENLDLAERFGISEHEFPQFRLFPAGWAAQQAEQPLVYEGAHTEEAMLRFIQEKAEVWIGLPGQSSQLHAIAKEFVGSGDQAAVLTRAGAAASGDADSKFYLKVMKRTLDDANFLEKERSRLKRMVGDGSVKQATKEQFHRRLNILSSFKGEL